MSLAFDALALWIFAQPAPGAGWEALVQKGVELRLAGHEQEALAVFRQAMQSGSAPRLLAQTALAEQSLGLWRDAETHLERALASDADPWIVKQRDALAKALVTIRTHLGTLELRGGEGGEVVVDGETAGTLPRGALRLEVGRHRIEVRRAGAYPFSRDVDIAAGGVSREQVTLNAVVEPPARLEPSSVPAAAPASAEHREVAASAPSASPSGAPRVIGWSLVAGGAAAAAFGAAALLVSNGRARDYNDDAACNGHADQPASCESAASAARSFRTASISCFVGGGVLAAAGAALIVWKASETPVHVRAAVGGAGPSLAVGGTF